VQIAKLAGAFPDKVVASAASLRNLKLVDPMRRVARQLEVNGAKALTTTCGFLGLLQTDLQTAVKIPVVTSSLMQLPALLKANSKVGVLTISAKHLSTEHLRAAGVARDDLARLVIQGVDPKTEFCAAILGNKPEMNLEQAAQDVLAAAVALKAKAPELEHVVLECTNMPPYAALIEAQTGLRCYSLLTDARLLKCFVG
jgi:Asp/Glu/hydantoin racemase